jgi:FKBP-type peptidyl-prolyl cis-trans isomerase FkpA
MLQRKMYFGWILGMLFLSISCSNNDKVKQTPDGLKYQFYTDIREGEQPEVNDILTASMIYSINDSVLFDSRQMPRPMQFPLMAPAFKGDFFEGIAMMRKGDSASFWSQADSVMLKVFNTGSIPPFVNPGDLIRFDIKLTDFSSQDEFMAKRAQEMESMQLDSQEKLKGYVEAEGISVAPTESGLYYIEIEPGKGTQPKPGERVKVHYTGKLLDGTTFDSSVDRGQPFVFTLGVGQVIRGWDEGIALMRVGGKARFIIPSQLAYGERDTGSIPPHSPLVFDVELISIED